MEYEARLDANNGEDDAWEEGSLGIVDTPSLTRPSTVLWVILLAVDT